MYIIVLPVNGKVDFGGKVDHPKDKIILYFLGFCKYISIYFVIYIILWSLI